MGTEVDTKRVRELLDGGAQALEVLPSSAFEREHLPGAVNIPLEKLTREAAGRLPRDRPVVVYCFDTQCDLSARAAALLEAYGFDEVYDYTGSKAAWLAMGLPAEGTTSDDLRAGSHVRAVATCKPSATAGEAVEHIDRGAEGEAPGICVIVDDDGIVLGCVRAEAAAAPHDTPVLSLMQPGPPTVRPSITVAELAASMDRQGQARVLVTTFDGRLLGMVLRSDLDVDA